MTVLLLVGVVLSICLGQLGVPPLSVLHTLLEPLGIDLGHPPEHPNAAGVIWTIRMPRVLMAVLVGAGLAVAGLLMQAIFGNPLAEPGVVGVSSGAAVGAAGAITMGLTFAGNWTIAIMAFTGGLLTTLFVYFFARSGGKTEVVTLLLTGIAVNAFAGAALALFSFLGDTQAREQIVFWQLGSLNGSRWAQVWVVLPLIVFGIAAAFLVVRKLDLLSLGEKPARHLGVNVEALRIAVVVLVSLLVGAAVAFAGIISFVGLVIPHLMRMLIGPKHLPLLVTSVLGGAMLLTLADLVARNGVQNSDLPLGMLTALVGGPFFFWLLRRTRKSAGGWA